MNLVQKLMKISNNNAEISLIDSSAASTFPASFSAKPHNLKLNEKLTKRLIFICNGRGKILASSHAEQFEIINKFNLTIEQGHLKFNLCPFQQQLKEYINYCSECYVSEENAKTVLVKQNGQYLALITVHSQNTENCYFYSLITITCQPDIAWLLVEREFDLTPKELELIKGLYRNEKLKDIAEGRKVSYYTLRAQLSAIFKKLNIKSQTEVIHLLNVFRR